MTRPRVLTRRRQLRPRTMPRATMPPPRHLQRTRPRLPTTPPAHPKLKLKLIPMPLLLLKLAVTILRPRTICLGRRSGGLRSRGSRTRLGPSSMLRSVPPSGPRCGRPSQVCGASSVPRPRRRRARLGRVRRRLSAQPMRPRSARVWSCPTRVRSRSRFESTSSVATRPTRRSYAAPACCTLTMSRTRQTQGMSCE